MALNPGCGCGVPVQRRRWCEGTDHRHALYGLPPKPGDEVASLCGRTVTVVVPVPGVPAPECPLCDRTWRDIEGIPQRDALLGAGVPGVAGVAGELVGVDAGVGPDLAVGIPA